MSKRRRESDPGGAAAETAELCTVFVDTNLGTHLAMLICSSDTVSDFKQKVAMEHKQCFPEIGEIQVHSVKVKRRSNYYHLPDIMHVWSAFHGVKRNWFLSVDASSIPTCLSPRNPLELGSSSDVKIGMTDIDDDCRGFISDANRKEILPLALTDDAAKNNAVSEMIGEPKVVEPVEETSDSHRNIYSEEHYMGTETCAKKKRKVRHAIDACHNSSLEGGDTMAHPNGKDGRPNMSDSIVKVSDARNDQYDVEGRLASEGTSLPSMAEKSNLGSILDVQNLNGFDRRKEDNGFKRMVDYGLSEDVHPLGVVSVTVPASSAGMMDASGGGGDVNTTGSKRKKKKVQKKAARVQDTKDMEQIGKGEKMKPCTEKMEEGKGLPLEDDDEVIMPSNSKTPDHVGPDLALKEASLLPDAEKSNFSIVNSHKLLDSDERKEDNALESKMDDEHDQDVPTMHSGGVCTNIPDLDHVGPDLALKEASLLQDAKKSNFNIVNSYKHVDSDERKEDNALESKMDNELDQDVRTVHSGGVCTNIPDVSAALTDAGGGSGDVNADGKKRKKKKVKKTAKVKDSDMEQIGKGGMKNPHTETIRSEDNGASLEHDNKVILPSDSKDPDHVDPDLALKEATVMRDADAVMEPEVSNCIKKMKKKKREKKSVGTNIGYSGITEFHNDIRGSLDLPLPSDDHIPKETGKVESIRLNEGKDVEMKLLDASNHDAQENVWEVNSTEAHLVETQTEQTLEDVSIGNKMMTEKTYRKRIKSSAGDCHTDFPTAENEKTNVESNQAERSNKNTENKYRKATNKRKNQTHTATDVQENLPVKDQQVGIKTLAIKETSMDFANSEVEGRHVDSSKVLSRKSEEKVDAMHELVVNTDGLTENSGKGGEGINFKQYFVADQLQNKVDSSDKVRKATKLKRSSTKAKDNGLPSVNILTEQQNSVKSFENKKTENNSHRKDTVRIKCDSAYNSDRDQMGHNSFKRSLEATEKEVKDSRPSELCEMTLQKPNDLVAASSFQKKKPSLDKSSSERSETLHNNMGKKRPLLGQNVTNMMQMKTPKKRNLLAKSEAIFQDNSGESSGDENRTMHSDDSTLSPSDRSSTSGDSEGESELSQNSTCNGMNDAKGKSTSKLDSSASKILSMDDILRSSKRFKKAKQLASQSETQPIDFVPDSQPS